MRRALDILVSAGTVLVVALGANQLSFEVAPKTYLSAVDPVVWIVFLAWTLQRFRERDLRSFQRVPLFTFLFLGTCALSTLRATSILSSAKDLFQFVEYFIAAYLVFSASLRHPCRRLLLVDTLLGVATLVVAIAAMQYVCSDVECFDVRGLFSNRNVLGGFIALVLPLAFTLVLHDNTWWRRAWLGCLILASTLVTLSGAAFLAMTVGCGFVALARGRRCALITGAAVVVLYSVVLPHMPRDNAEVLYQSTALFTDDGELKGRYPEWQAAAVMTLENPWIGVGIGNYQDHVGTYYGMLPSPNRATEPDSQCLFLVLPASIGIPGLLAFLALLGGGLVTALRQAGRAMTSIDRALTIGSAASLVAFCIAAIWSPLLVRGIGIPLSLILALSFTDNATTEPPPTAP